MKMCEYYLFQISLNKLLRFMQSSLDELGLLYIEVANNLSLSFMSISTDIYSQKKLVYILTGEYLSPV